MKHDYQSMEKYIRQAQLERQIYLANLIADSILFLVSKIKSVINRGQIIVDSIGEGSQQSRTHKSVFSFDN